MTFSRTSSSLALDAIRGDAIHTLRSASHRDYTDSAAHSRAEQLLRSTSRGKILSGDARVMDALRVIDRVAGSVCTVLITGESGTGKELAVAALHDASPRNHAPLVAVNCGAIPHELVESELFGATRGAFTGAQISRRGYLAAAEGGTLFLDEIGELPLPVQVKLLRPLQQREYTPLGETRPIPCNVRIVAATNRNLEHEVAAGRFREDLFFRLNVVNVHLPPLRKRHGDAAMLAGHFFRECCERAGREDLVGFTDDAMKTIEAHVWPGNIRALANTVERGVLVAEGPCVGIRDLFPARTSSFMPAVRLSRELRAIQVSPAVIESSPGAPQVLVPQGGNSASSAPRHNSSAFPRVLPDAGLDLARASERYENNLIHQALSRTGGNKNRAAQLLGLNRTTLVEMMRRRRLAASQP
jgi:sigma-54 dependent transcriptional regulator, flagellar regulatory protein